ncbi:MAG: hypothetical protein F2750_02170 [Actinobacteria bacterium]|jgi:hypothetical protein|uniref:Unannotated protein n=1 Tax=freshwater metagenome TaxID=449393 RepID=A0A6J6YKG1_9ZZZZ|nr:hypothetical protein [Actinomycetota bacterium]MTA91257.1 hypothetical protein [Actinomycetota bacterium]
MLGGINNGLFLSSFGGFFAVGILSLILIWAFKRGKSVVARTPKVGGEDDYGALVVIASPNNYIEGELMRLKLATAEIRANLAHTKDGPRLYVFERDEQIARAVLKS